MKFLVILLLVSCAHKKPTMWSDPPADLYRIDWRKKKLYTQEYGKIKYYDLTDFSTSGKVCLDEGELEDLRLFRDYD